MTKLNQIVAIEKGVKQDTQRDLTAAYHKLERSPLLDGLSRNYTPYDDDGERYPPESKLVQHRVEDTLEEIGDIFTRLFDVVLTKDTTNTIATANVVVDGDVIAEAVPVSYLLFLEKQLTDLYTVMRALPTLDPEYKWTWDNSTETFATDPVETVKQKKIYRNHVKAEATDKHPAQVEVYTEDVGIGRWATRKFSGAVPQTRKTAIVNRIRKLREAVEFARQTANNTTVEDQEIGDSVFTYLFGGDA
jgi:hypothetical protein